MVKIIRGIIIFAKILSLLYIFLRNKNVLSKQRYCIIDTEPTTRQARACLTVRATRQPLIKIFYLKTEQLQQHSTKNFANYANNLFVLKMRNNALSPKTTTITNQATKGEILAGGDVRPKCKLSVASCTLYDRDSKHSLEITAVGGKAGL